MAISFIGAATADNINGGNATFNLAAASPSGPSDGDLVLIVSSARGASGNETRIGNALSYTELSDTVSTLHRVRTAAKVFGSAETAPVIEGSGDALHALSGTALIFRGQDATYLDVAVAISTGTSTNPDPASITPTNNDCMVVVLAGSGNLDTSPGTMTNYTVVGSNAGNDTRPAASAGAYRLLTGGAGSPENPAAFSSWSTGDWVSITIALRVSGAGAAGQPAAKRMGGVPFAGDYRTGGAFKMWRRATELLLPPRPAIIRI